MNDQNAATATRATEMAQPDGSAGEAQEPPSDPRSSPWGRARHAMRLIARTLGALLVGAAAVLGSIMAFRQGLLPLLETGFALGPDALSAVRRVGILAAGIAGYWAYVHWFEKRDATELRLRLVPLLPGGIGGVLLVAVPIALLFALGAYELVQVRALSSGLWSAIAVIAIAATLEELVYRCLLFRVIERYWGTATALVLQAVVFSVQHLENTASGTRIDAAMMLASVTVLGLLWAGVFMLTRNLWVAAVNHGAWNFTILLSGVPLSGIEDWRAMAPLETRLAGPDWLTGGMFGPENSLLVIASASLATVLVLHAAWRRKAFVAAVSVDREGP